MGSNWQKNTTWAGYENGLSQAAFNGTSAFGVINQFKFLAAKSIRTSTIILAAFNTISAFATAAGIFYDCYMTAKRSNLEGNKKVNIIRCVRGSQTYPFILSLGITIQGIIFAVSQSYGLNGLFIPGCAIISQIMWPAIFIVPYIQLVFGLEVAFRALKKRPFPPRGKWNIAICLVIVKVLLVITGLVGVFVQPPTFCFASLFWFVAKWAKGGFAILLIITVVLATCIAIIFTKLTRYSIIEDSERVAASRMVFYLALAVVTNALIVPFFIDLVFSDPVDNSNTGLTLSMISSVVANVTGLMTGGLHLFLRSNTIGTIGHKDKLTEHDRQKLGYQTQMKGSSSMDFNGHMLQPVSGPQILSRMDSQVNLISEKGDIEDRGESPFSRNPLKSNATYEVANPPQVSELAQVPPTPSTNMHGRRPSTSYNLFPGKNPDNTTSVALLPSTAYNPNIQSSLAAPNPTFNFDFEDALRPPPSIYARHKRDSSMSSSATVQIGLRVSNLADIGPMPKLSAEAERLYSLDYPRGEEMINSYRPSPLATFATSNVPPPQNPIHRRESRDKNLPPTPTTSEAEASDCTLSPAVYNPNSPTKTKTPSPRGVGFSVPRRVNTTPNQGAPTQLPTRSRGNSSSAAENRSDWI